MTEAIWTVNVVGQAKKADKNLSSLALDSFSNLLDELRKQGPYRTNWPNYTKVFDDNYHCHLKKSHRPTYVVCWIVYKKQKLIEVNYAGTHENAPY